MGKPQSQLLLLHCSIALAAIYGSVVLGLKGDLCFAAAVSANSCKEFLSSLTCILTCIAASLASLGLVLEASFCIELLLACGEYEISAAILAL